MSDPTRPTPPLPTADQVPTELLSLKRWIGYRLEDDKKPPASAVTGEGIGATLKYADHFLTFAEALAGAKQHGLDGVGFVFVDSDGYVGLDFDDCVKNGVIHPVVADWLKWFTTTYAEISPSGTGIHIIGKGKITKALKATPLPGADGAKIEAYSHSRYFTFTGQSLGVNR